MSRRARTAAIGLVVCACVSAGWQLGRVLVTPAPVKRYPAVVAEHDTRRFAGLSDVLPPGGVVGYVTNEPDSAEATRAYYLAQYALAPTVLVRDDRRELVIVDDRPECEVPPSSASGRVLRDLGNGVRLLGREEP